MKNTKVVKIGNILIGGGNPVAVQSMTNTDTADRAATLRQIKRLERAGCEIVRFTVNTFDAAKNIAYYKEHTSVPLVADIHFDYKLALESAAAGIDKIRINPGNIG
ncbi:MAG: flavodoxin-dependent (E)-4-hydroxy-3-methylbut-2-enyl-diphosphate synthase, partial [Clostridia bacterium]|nr:flavodoxin-dependent (E)-4-hydroxy-3-methylbut-2-enyl-diphosphate synthase [Clostridia bacterium]